MWWCGGGPLPTNFQRSTQTQQIIYDFIRSLSESPHSFEVWKIFWFRDLPFDFCEMINLLGTFYVKKMSDS